MRCSLNLAVPLARAEVSLPLELGHRDSQNAREHVVVDEARVDGALSEMTALMTVKPTESFRPRP